MIEDETEVVKPSVTVESFAAKHLELIEIERDAEIEENRYLQECRSVKSLEKKGVCIPKLRIGSTSTGLFGRSLLHFESFWQKGPLPSHIITSGDIVGIGNLNSDGKIEVVTSGIVTRVSESVVSVAFEKNSNFSDLENDTQYMVIKLANDVTYKRLKRVLKTLESKGRESPLVDVFFGDKTPTAFPEAAVDSLEFLNKNLNEAQEEAVRFALLQREVAIIHGPPGTGKTTTVVECILQAVAQKLRVLACAPSNVAVDNLVEKLSAYKVKMVRLGHPARFLSSIQQYSLDAIINRYDGSNVVEELHKEIEKLRERINKTKGSNVRKSMWAENRSLLKEVKAREKIIVKHVLANADVVLCTLTSGSDDGPLKYIEEKDRFDVCFIDECSQAIEAACWIPLLQTKRCVIAGDHHQLPPTIVSKKAARDGLQLTLMERLLSRHGDGIKRMLTTQYRMNEAIMKWPSEKLYESKLVAHFSVQRHLLSDLEGVESNQDTAIPLLLIDTDGSGLAELEVEDDESKGNEGEADLVAAHVESLVKSGVRAKDIAVVTPYNLQVELVKARLASKYPALEIKSVDGFQGREKEAIVLSLVRSNQDGEVGFLSEDRRINVAITRARRHLAVICDSRTVSFHGFLKSFLSYCEEKGEVRTAFQYENDIGHHPVLKQAVTSTKREGKKTVKEAKSMGRKPAQSHSSKSFQSKDYTPLHNAEEKRCIEEKYEQIVQKFVESTKLSLQLPASLTAFERRTVHEIAEKLGLQHSSTGEGAERCIEVKKHTSEDSAPQTNHIDNKNSKKTTSVKEQVASQPSQGNTVTNNLETTNNSEPSSLQLQMDSSNEPKPSTTPPVAQSTKASNSKGAKAKKPKPKLKVVDLKGEGEEDFDALIEQAVKADKTCRYGACKQSVATLSQVCQFCRGRFCYSHFIPEAHGCGDAAKAQARSQIRKDRVLYAGSGKPEKKVDPIKHSYLQNKLEKKIGELSNKRKTKQKEDSKKS